MIDTAGAGRTLREIGLIGLGRMGREIGPTLLRAGFHVTATSRSADSRQSMLDVGVSIAETPIALTERCDVILISVFDTEALTNVINGENGILPGIKPGVKVIDLGTSAIEETLRLDDLIKKAGGEYFDAPVSGGTRGAATGQLTIMVGGGTDALAGILPVLKALGQVNHMGEVGAGQSTKAINQLILGQTFVAVAEGLSLADKLGLNLGHVRAALLGGFAESRVLAEHGQRIVDSNFTPGGSISVFSKDLRLVANLVDGLGLRLPGLTNADSLYRLALAEGMGGLDQSALYNLYKMNSP